VKFYLMSGGERKNPIVSLGSSQTRPRNTTATTRNTGVGERRFPENEESEEALTRKKVIRLKKGSSKKITN